jgi:hypothetical protein
VGTWLNWLDRTKAQWHTGFGQQRGEELTVDEVLHGGGSDRRGMVVRCIVWLAIQGGAGRQCAPLGSGGLTGGRPEQPGDGR